MVVTDTNMAVDLAENHGSAALTTQTKTPSPPASVPQDRQMQRQGGLPPSRGDYGDPGRSTKSSTHRNQSSHHNDQVMDDVSKTTRTSNYRDQPTRSDQKSGHSRTAGDRHGGHGPSQPRSSHDTTDSQRPESSLDRKSRTTGQTPPSDRHESDREYSNRNQLIDVTGDDSDDMSDEDTGAQGGGHQNQTHQPSSKDVPTISRNYADAAARGGREHPMPPHSGKSVSASAQAAAHDARRSGSRPEQYRSRGGEPRQSRYADEPRYSGDSTVNSSGGQGIISGVVSATKAFLGGPPQKSERDPQTEKLMDEIQRMKRELDRRGARIQALENEVHHTKTELQRSQDYGNSLGTELKNVRRELEDSLHLSEVRGRELVGAQVFLTKADSLSVSELQQQVTELNDEIFQASAFLAETIVYGDGQWTSDDETYRKMAQSVCDFLGDPLTRLLIHFSQEPQLTEPDQFLVQLTLQLCLTRFCYQITKRWTDDDETNSFLASVYGEVRKTEDQAVSGRWRAITHAKTRPTGAGWAESFARIFEKVLTLANWRLDTKGDAGMLEQKLHPIFKVVLRVRIALGEHFTSSDIEPLVVYPGAPYDAMSMEDALMDERKSKKAKHDANKDSGPTDIVIATAGIGLKQWYADDKLADKGGYHIVMPPKVILHSTLHEILNPPPKKSRSAPRPPHE